MHRADQEDHPSTPEGAQAWRAVPVEQEERERDAVDRVAREWIGTPYHNHGEVKGPRGGVDCAKLLKCVFVETGKLPPFTIAHYSPQFFLHQEEEKYLGYIRTWGREIEQSQARHGDIVVYKIGKCYAHGGIIVKPGWPTIIHAHYAARLVLEANGTAVHLGTPILGMKFFSMW